MNSPILCSTHLLHPSLISLEGRSRLCERGCLPSVSHPAEEDAGGRAGKGCFSAATTKPQKPWRHLLPIRILARCGHTTPLLAPQAN